MNPQPDPALWLAALLVAGALGAIAGRAAGVPAPVAALAAGAIAALAAGPPAGGGATLWLPRAFALSWLGLLLGAGLDLRASLRGAGLRGMLLSGLTVFVFTGSVTWGAGFSPDVAVMIALIMTAGSPLAAISVCAEARARGPLTGRLLGSSAFTFAAAAVAAGMAAPPHGGLSSGWRPLAALALGAACGGVLLLPLSRTATRPGYLIMGGLGATLIVMAGTRLGGDFAWLLIMAVAAGAMAGHFTRAGTLAREAMRDLAVPAAVVWFALEAAAAPWRGVARWLGVALLLVAARVAALQVAARLTRAPRGVALAALAMAPCGGWLIFITLLPASYSGNPMLQDLNASLVIAMVLSEALGMVAARHALARGREGVAVAEDATAWRAPMR